MIKIGNTALGEFPLLLAPMEGVTDPSFRAICKEYGADMVYTEFVSVEGLIRNVKKSKKKISIFPNERPVGIQIYGANLDSMLQATEVIEEAQPEVLDINYGCPVSKVVNRMCGAGILQDIDRMVALTKAVVEATSLPVTVKTRLGWTQDTIRIEEVVQRLQEVGIQAITIHARTRRQMYKGEADWSWLRRIKQNPNITIPVFGNGDIDGPIKASEYKKKYLVDGIMIGRAAIGRPWIFNTIKHYLQTGEVLPEPSIPQRIAIVKRHLQHSLEWKGEKVGVLEMRRHYVNYFKAIPHFKPIRLRLLTEMNPSVVLEILDEIEHLFSSVQPIQI